MNSVYELASSYESINAHIEILNNSVKKLGDAHLMALESQMRMRAAKYSLAPVNIIYSDLEKRTDVIIPSLTAGAFKMGQGKLAEMLSSVPEKKISSYPVRSAIDRTEISRLVNGNNSVLMIKKMLDAQNRQQTDLTDIMNFIHHLKEAGVVVF